jgi:peptidoglycan/LPS O-acetylase OafA/YrhL
LWPVTHCAVLGFFVLSGFVLCRSFTGSHLPYAVRRLVRLMPLYLVCTFVGCWELGRLPTIGELGLWPLPDYPNLPAFNPPSWSLYYEIWAIPLSPMLFRVCRSSRLAGLGLAAATAPLVVIFGNRLLDCIPAFILGAALTQFTFELPARVPSFSVAIGTISYSLYLSHGLVMLPAAHLIGAWGVVLSLPVVFAVAYAAWWLIELPSIAWSRRLGRMLESAEA